MGQGVEIERSFKTQSHGDVVSGASRHQGIQEPQPLLGKGEWGWSRMPAPLEGWQGSPTALGGPKDFSGDWRRKLPEANVIREVPAPSAGHIASIDGKGLGWAVVHLGGGRMRDGDKIDPSVGLDQIVMLGEKVDKGQPLLRIHASSERAASRAEKAVLEAIEIGDRTEPGDLIKERIG